MCVFPDTGFKRSGATLVAVLVKPYLTLTMPAAIALPAALLVYEGIAAALRTKITRHT